MSALHINSIQMGKSNESWRNFTLGVPGVQDGTVSLWRGNWASGGQTVAHVDSVNNVWFANRIGSGADATADSDTPRWGQVKAAVAAGAHFHTSGILAMDNVGTDNNGYYNYVYPPTGKTIGNIINVICSIREIYYNGKVDNNDSTYCYYEVEWANNRVKFICYNSERRWRCAINWDIAWSA